MEKLENAISNAVYEIQKNLGYYETLYKTKTCPSAYGFTAYWKDSYEYCKLINEFLSNLLSSIDKSYLSDDYVLTNYSEGVKDAIVLRDNLIEQLKDVYPPYYWSNIDKDTEIKEVYIHKLHVAGLYSNLIGLAKEKALPFIAKNESSKASYLLPLIYIWENEFHFAMNDLNYFSKNIEPTDEDLASIKSFNQEKIMFEETEAEAKQYFDTIDKKLCDVYFYYPQQYVIDNH